MRVKHSSKTSRLTLLDLLVCNDDLLLSILLRFGSRKSVHLVGAFRPPGNIVQVAKGVDVLGSNHRTVSRDSPPRGESAESHLRGYW